MSDVFDNAIKSITLGIEDFRTKTDIRMLSAARNYYAGLLLLAKECLIRAAPKSDPMKVIGAQYKPIPDGNDGVKYEVSGDATVNLDQLQRRFKDFKLKWPDVDIKQLQRFRNDLEHYHLKKPADLLSEAIGSSFPMIIDFFEILDEDPQEYLEGVWETIINEHGTFKKVRENCLRSWEGMNWPATVKNLNKLACPDCRSSLVGQSRENNTDHEQIEGKCFKCGYEVDHNVMMEMIVYVSYEFDAYVMVKDGEIPPIGQCPECMANAYVEVGEKSVCFVCGESIKGNCLFCGTRIYFFDYDSNHPGMCGYCAHQYEKLTQE